MARLLALPTLGWFLARSHLPDRTPALHFLLEEAQRDTRTVVAQQCRLRERSDGLEVGGRRFTLAPRLNVEADLLTFLQITDA